MVGTAKLASIFIVFGLSAFSGVISCVTVRCLVLQLTSSKFKRAISILNCLSGGVFFATSVLHLLPEARESMEDALEGYDFSSEYPFTELLMCIGFFLILAFEHFAHACCSSNRDNSSARQTYDENDQRHDSPAKRCISCSAYTDMPVGNNKIGDRASEKSALKERIVAVSESSYHVDTTYQTYGATDESVNKTSVRPYSDLQNESATPDVKEVSFQDSDIILIKNAETKNQSTRNALEQARNSAYDDPARSRLRGFVLLIALSLHMIFEGLALGLLTDDTEIWTLLVALSLHKILVFFTLGLQTLEVITSLGKTILVIVIFALISPCGIIIGESINLSGESVAKDMSSAILQGIATGTFLFVTFFGILQRELGTGDHDLVKVFTTVLGFGLVACIRLLEHED